MALNDYGTVTLDANEISTILNGSPTVDQSSPSNQNGEIITETVPYLLTKDGPNAHLFKFQTVKRVNHVQKLLYRNIAKQHRESL